VSSRIIPVSVVARLSVERPDSRGSIPGWWGNCYVTVSRSNLPPLQWAWALQMKLGPTTHLVLIFCLTTSTFAKTGNTAPVIHGT
jgi:hypothetical protein